jgi:hypothetical protein
VAGGEYDEQHAPVLQSPGYGISCFQILPTMTIKFIIIQATNYLYRKLEYKLTLFKI